MSFSKIGFVVFGLFFGWMANAQTFSFTGGAGNIEIPHEVGKIISAEIVLEHSYVNGPDIRITGSGGGAPRGYRDLMRIPVEIQNDGVFVIPDFSFDRPLSTHFFQNLFQHRLAVYLKIALISRAGDKILIDQTPLIYDIASAQKRGDLKLIDEVERRVQFRKFGENSEYRIGGDTSPKYRELTYENLEMLGLSSGDIAKFLPTSTQSNEPTEVDSASASKCIESLRK